MWQECIIRFDGEALGVCRNGIPVDQPAPFNHRFLPHPNPFLIGAELVNGTPGRLFHGDMAEVAVWTRALTPDEQLDLWEPTHRRTALDYKPVPRRSINLPEPQK